MLLIIIIMLSDHPSMLLEARFTGANRELAQGAVERHDLRHREIEPRVWLIEVEEGDPDAWARRLTSALPAGEGTFEVRAATREQIEKVRSGEIALQR